MKKGNVKILLICLVMAILSVGLLYNIVMLDVKGYHIHSGINLSDYNGISYVSDERIPASRGRIYDRNGVLIASDMDAWDVIAYVSPDRPGNKLGVYYVDDEEYTADVLADILHGDREEILALLNQDVFMTYLGTAGRCITREQKERIEALDLNGIEFVKVSSRYYPLSPFSSHLIGFARYVREDDGGSNVIQGQTGLEVSLDDYLIGVEGSQSYYRATNGSPIVGQQTDYTAPINGKDVYLTIDSRIQTAFQKMLAKSMNSGFSGELSWGMVLEAQTGRILAYDTYPTFNQNDVDIDSYLDYNSMVSYEAGSVIKTFTYAAALDASNLSPDDTYNGNRYYVGWPENGHLTRVGYEGAPGWVSTIQNWNDINPGTVNFWYAYSTSMNSGVLTLLEKYIDIDTYKEYLYNFGFFKPVEVYGIINEAEGIANLEHPLDIATSTFGQGCGYTALQVMQAYTAFCNKGKMIKPYIVDKIVDSYTGETVYQGKTEVVGEPIKPETADTILKMMQNTIDTDTGGAMFVSKDLSAGGKTGTAEVAENGVYGGKYIHSIVLTFPAQNPELLVYVCYKDRYAFATNQKHVQELEKTLSEIYSIKRDNIKDEPTENTRREFRNGMPNLVNHTLQYANKKLADVQANMILLGNGNTVIAQYPAENSTLVSGQRIMLLVNKENLQMPSMIGWSRKEVTAFWELTGIQVTLDGSGYVTSQSVPVGESINQETRITVKLE